MNGKKGLVPSNFVERVKRTSSHQHATTSSSSSAHRHITSSNTRHVTSAHHDSVRNFFKYYHTNFNLHFKIWIISPANTQRPKDVVTKSFLTHWHGFNVHLTSCSDWVGLASFLKILYSYNRISIASFLILLNPSFEKFNFYSNHHIIILK